MEGRFRREGTYVYPWLIHVDVRQKPTQYCQAVILQLKINKVKNKKRLCASNAGDRGLKPDWGTKIPNAAWWLKKKTTLNYNTYMGYVCVCVLSRVRLFATPRTVAHQAPLSMGFPRQEYWSGLRFPPPGDLPNPGIEPASPALAGRFFTTEPPGKTMG